MDRTLEIKLRIAKLKIEAHEAGRNVLPADEIEKYRRFVQEHESA